MILSFILAGTTGGLRGGARGHRTLVQTIACKRYRRSGVKIIQKTYTIRTSSIFLYICPMPREDLIKLRRGTAAQWAAVNPILAIGEPGLETDTLKIKYGNGIAAWNDLPYPSADGGGVTSVNGEAGAVVLDALDVGAYPNSNPSNYISASGAPVQSVNTQTGDVVLDAADVGAYPDSNPSNYISASGAPVQSVNTQTGAVVLDAADVGADPAGSAATALLSANNYTDSQLDTKQNKSTVVSSNTTAALDGVYTNVASATYTDPSPAEGKGFVVFVRNGTATVGGTGYATAGTIINRVFHSGSWANYVYQVSSTFYTQAEVNALVGNGFFSKIITSNLTIPADNFKYVSDYCEVADGITVTLETNSTLEVG